MISRRKFLWGSFLTIGAGLLSQNTSATERKTTSQKPLLPNPAQLFYPFSLPPLPYAYEALEPYLDTQTMTLHHQKHHAAYVNNLNKALETRQDLQQLSLQELLLRCHELAPEVAKTILNNGGGHLNHSILWVTLHPQPEKTPQGPFAEALQRDFGSFAQALEKLQNAAMSVFGSGWAWLCFDYDGKLSVVTLPNQDPPLIQSLNPLLGIDVWEHAYYLKFQNRRADYITAFLNTVDWATVSQAYNLSALAC